MAASIPPITATVSPSAGTFSCCPNWTCCVSGSTGTQTTDQDPPNAQAGGSASAIPANTPAAGSVPAAAATANPKDAVLVTDMKRAGAIKA